MIIFINKEQNTVCFSWSSIYTITLPLPATFCFYCVTSITRSRFNFFVRYSIFTCSSFHYLVKPFSSVSATDLKTMATDMKTNSVLTLPHQWKTLSETRELLDQQNQRIFLPEKLSCYCFCQFGISICFQIHITLSIRSYCWYRGLFKILPKVHGPFSEMINN